MTATEAFGWMALTGVEAFVVTTVVMVVGFVAGVLTRRAIRRAKRHGTVSRIS